MIPGKGLGEVRRPVKGKPQDQGEFKEGTSPLSLQEVGRGGSSLHKEDLNILDEEILSSSRDMALLVRDSMEDAGDEDQSSSTAAWERVKRLKLQLALSSGGEDRMLRLSG